VVRKPGGVDGALEIPCDELAGPGLVERVPRARERARVLDDEVGDGLRVQPVEVVEGGRVRHVLRCRAGQVAVLLADRPCADRGSPRSPKVSLQISTATPQT
jgi:hypothetical protein